MLLPVASSTSFCLPAASSTSGGSGSEAPGAAAGAESAGGFPVAGAFPAAEPAVALERGAVDRPAPPLPVERPLRLGGGAQRQRTVAQPLARIRLVGAQPHGANAPPGGSFAVAELAHRVVEQAGAATLQEQPACLDLGQVVDDGALQVAFVEDQGADLTQQLAIGEGADGGGDGGEDVAVRSGGIHGVNITMVFR